MLNTMGVFIICVTRFTRLSTVVAVRTEVAAVPYAYSVVRSSFIREDFTGESHLYCPVGTFNERHLSTSRLSKSC